MKKQYRQNPTHTPLSFQIRELLLATLFVCGAFSLHAHTIIWTGMSSTEYIAKNWSSGVTAETNKSIVPVAPATKSVFNRATEVPRRGREVALPTPITETFNYTGTIVTWTVPDGVSSLTIEAKGAEGGFGPPLFGNPTIYSAGMGAIISGVIPVTGGQQLKILVGQKSPQRNGGGGGSFVTDNANQPLMIAGGGGGSGVDNDALTKNGQTGTSGGNGSGSNGGSGGNAGTGGTGGTAGANSAGGGGLLTDGTGANSTVPGGKAFVSGGAGGGGGGTSDVGIGGFGGGGAGTGVASGGGGGGYSGGGGGNGPGGGGGSFNSGTDQNNLAGANTGDGLVTITYQFDPPTTCPPITFTPTVSNVRCQGGSDGSIALTPSGGTAPYTYSIDGGANYGDISTLSGRSAGSYSVRVKDANDCESEAQPVTIGEPATALSASVSGNTSVVFGFGSNCTTLTASGSGGTGSYTYAWSAGANPTNTASTEVCPQTTTTYTVTVTDANTCQATAQVTVNVQDVRCGNRDQNVTICYYGVTQCVSEKIAARYLKLGATIGGCGTGNARLGVPESAALPLQLSLKAFPNPVQDAVTLEVLAPNAGRGTFEVLDVTGRVRQSRQESLVEGLNEVEFRLGSLPTGIYLIKAVDALNNQGVVRVSKE